MKIQTLLFCIVAIASAALVPRCFAAPLDVPDVVLEQLDFNGMANETVGRQIFDNDAQQTLATAVTLGQTQNYLVRIKNKSASGTTFRLSLGGLTTAAGEETVWKAKGWSGHAALDGETTNVFAQLTSPAGWETPRVNFDDEIVLRLSLTAPNTLTGASPDASFRLVARRDNSKDAAVGRIGVQFIDKIQWTQDADDSHPNRWHDVTETTSILVVSHAVVGVRAIKGVPSTPWGGRAVLGPTWTFQGNTIEGDEVWMQAQNPTATGAPLTATLGNSKSFQVRVLPDAFVELTVDAGSVQFPDNATVTQPTLVSATVVDEDDEPLTNIKVRLRAFKGKVPVSCLWTPVGGGKATAGTEHILLTDKNGQVSIQWAVTKENAKPGDKITIKAKALDETGKAFGDDDDFEIGIETDEDDN